MFCTFMYTFWGFDEEQWTDTNATDSDQLRIIFDQAATYPSLTGPKRSPGPSLGQMKEAERCKGDVISGLYHTSMNKHNP